MRFGDRRTSDNVESQRGQSFGGGGGGGGGLGAGAGMLISFVASRFGFWGIVALVAIFLIFGGGLGDIFGGGSQRAVAPQPTQQQPGTQAGGNVCQSDPATRFACQVLGSTEDRWSEIFRENGRQYQPPKMVVYDRRGASGCGAADSAMGPFYCPADQGIYLDTEFFRELAQRFRAPGDFAQAYVIAHEVGHHIQTLTGTAGRIRQAQQATSEARGNALQVRMELQADCYAGVWAARERVALEPGDMEEGMTAASAIGDDTLQRAAQGTVVPESFTHGTSAQRQEALMRGFNGGNPAACETYTQGI